MTNEHIMLATAKKLIHFRFPITLPLKLYFTSYFYTPSKHHSSASISYKPSIAMIPFPVNKNNIFSPIYKPLTHQQSLRHLYPTVPEKLF